MSFNISLSGLNAAQKDLDVTGNNIANSSTIGFKQSRAEFADVFSNSVFANTKTQVGSGVNTAAVTQQFSQGALQSTSNSLDLAIKGDGFFILAPDATSLERSYTRAGAFQVNDQGYVTNSLGDYLQVYDVDPITGTPKTVSVNSTSSLQIPTEAGTPTATDAVDETFNLPASIDGHDPTLFDYQDSSTYDASTSVSVYDSLGDKHILTQYFVKDPSVAGTWYVFNYLDTNYPVNIEGGVAAGPNGTGTLALAPTAAKLVFGANGKLDTASSTDPVITEALGSIQLDASALAAAQAAVVAATTAKTDANAAAQTAAQAATDAQATADASAAASVTATADAQTAAQTLIDAQAAYDQAFIAAGGDTTDQTVIDAQAAVDAAQIAADAAALAATDAQAAVDAQAAEDAAAAAAAAADAAVIAAQAALTPGAEALSSAVNQAQTLTINFNNLSQYASSFSVSSIYQNGSTVGQLTNVSIGDDGVVAGTYSNGVTTKLGMVALAKFSNPQRLTQVGDTCWKESQDSGEAVPGTPGVGTFGSVNASALEASNTDLSTELVDLIAAQRNYQANSRALEVNSTLQDTILQIR